MTIDDRPPHDAGSRSISTGGGAYVGGPVHVENGDFIARDKITYTGEQAFDVSGLQNPYLGLASYTYAQRAFYGGREEQVDEAVQRLTAPGSQQVLLFVTGASGCGKSSFVQAGLIPALEHGYAEHARSVRWAVARPGRHPLAALARAFEDLGLASASSAPFSDARIDLRALLSTARPSDQVNVLVLDQFEELMIQSEPAERDAVLALLSHLPSFDQIHTHVIVTLRYDYLQAVFQVPALFDVLKQQGIELRAMLPDELSRAIARPLDELDRQFGKDKSIQPDLLKRLIEDVGTDSSLLPLLQVTLSALWDEPPHRLTSEYYRTLTDKLQVKADRVYAQDRQHRPRSEAERSAILAIFLDLVRVSLDDDPHRDARQTLTLREVLGDHPERRVLVEELVENRLLATWGQQEADGSLAVVERVDIIHETLLTNWTTLRAAIAARRNVLQGRERFRLFLREWESHARADAYLLHGVQLDAARELESQKDVALQDPNARQFWELSQRTAEQERQVELTEERARSRGLRRRLLLALTALGIAAASTAMAIWLALLNDQQVHLDASRELAAEATSQLPTQPELSILLAREALRIQTTEQATIALRRALLNSPARLEFRISHGLAHGVAFSRDGTSVAIGDEDGLVRLVDAYSGEPRAELKGHTGTITTVRFSEDGQRILTAGIDGQVRVWSAQTGAPVRSFAGIEGQALDASFSSDGSNVAAADNDGITRVWDASTGRLRSTMSLGTAGPVLAVRFAPDGQRVASGGQTTTRVWDVNSGQAVRDLPGRISKLGGDVFDSQGQRIVTLGADATAQVWDLETGALVSLGGQSEAVKQAIFSPVDPSVLTISQDGTSRIWDARGGQRQTLSGIASTTAPPVFSRDGSRVVAVGPNYDALVWDLPSKTMIDLQGHTALVSDVELSPDGRSVATVGLDRMVRVWNADAGRDWLPLAGHANAINSVATADGGRVATGSSDQTVRVWRLEGSPVASIRRLPAGVRSVAFSQDGQRIAAGLEDGRTWILQSDAFPPGTPALGRDEVELDGHTSRIDSAVFSRDGQRLATASDDGTGRVWDARTGHSVGSLPDLAGAVTTVAFDPQGQRLASGNSTGKVRIWDARTLQPVADLGGFSARVNRVAFSPDGHLVIAGGAEGVARVWQADNGREVKVLGGHTGEILGVSFSPGGTMALTTSGDHTAQIWDTATWQSQARLTGGQREFNDGAFSQNEQQVVIGSGDGLLREYTREAFGPLGDLLALVPKRLVRDPELSSSERAEFVPMVSTFAIGIGH